MWARGDDCGSVSNNPVRVSPIAGLCPSTVSSNVGRIWPMIAGRAADDCRSLQVAVSHWLFMEFVYGRCSTGQADSHTASHADRARLQAELERQRAELARARRPWWRRLIGT